MPENVTDEIYSLKEKLDKLEREYYYLNDWFDKYDRIIWTLRSLLFTIYAAVIVYSFNAETSIKSLFFALSLFSLFFLCMEIYWLCAYWKKRTQRYKEIQIVVNDCLENKPPFETPLLNMDRSLSNKNCQNCGERINLLKKIIEPTLFYVGLVIIAFILFVFI
ncbi:MAG: hypothetical protein KGY61_13955 [Desulfobacterales bacterium]|nr:hypothetical protein [Desulfobacterales bacterium]